MTFYTFGLNTDLEKLYGELDPTHAVNKFGGKGAGLVWLTQQGVRVPPGFIIPTDVWSLYHTAPKVAMKAIAKELPSYLEQLRSHFGYMPLLSVRSGARVSCPGMMDTILNVGIDADSQDFWKEKLGQVAFNDSLHRLVTMYGSVVTGIDRQELEPGLMQALTAYSQVTGKEFPDAEGQLLGAIEAVFKSWDSDRNVVYRKQHDIPQEWGTAVTVQAMVFGNLNDQSGTGVLFTRNPDTGFPEMTGDFLPNAQGEDIVAGIRTPLPIYKMAQWNPAVYDTLSKVVWGLEQTKKDVQDIEFTVQDGVLYFLQTRSAKRSATAAIRIALDMVNDGLLTPEEALARVTPKQFDLAQVDRLDPSFTTPENLKGIAACSGVVKGRPVFTKEEVLASTEPVILVRNETTPEDIAGMFKAVGVITMIGGFTSHAAVNARGMDRACIVGVGADTSLFTEVDIVSMDGATGRIWTQDVPIIKGGSKGLIEEWVSFLMTTKNLVPVIMKEPDQEMPEAMLYLGAAILNPPVAVALVQAVAGKVKRLYLDLTPATAAEAEFLSLAVTTTPTKKVIALLKKLPLSIKARLVLVGGSEPHPFKTVGSGADIRSLVLADGEIAIGADALSDPAVQKVLAWKKAEGLSFVSVGQWVKDTKSIVSVEQALQLAGG